MDGEKTEGLFEIMIQEETRGKKRGKKRETGRPDN